MTTNPHPFVTRPRTADSIDAALSAQRTDATPARANDALQRALGRVFAHYCAVLTERLNAAPMQHLSAFAELLGAPCEPATAARAPLAFKATPAGPLAPAPVVPKYTEVAAPGAGAQAQPVVFQTTADLDVLRAEAVRAVWVDPPAATLANAAALISTYGLPEGDTLATHALPLVRALHIGHRPFFGAPDLTGFMLDVQIAQRAPQAAPLALQWGIDAPEGFVPLHPSSDTTHGLTRSGAITFDAPPKWPATRHGGIENGWLTCRQQNDARESDAFDASGPFITGLALSADRALAGATLDAARANGLPLDLSRDFYPFGERPRFNDVLYLASNAFAVAGARVVLGIDLTNPADAAPAATPIPPVTRDGAPRIVWEAHTAGGWRALAADDGTHALTTSGQVSLAIPADALPVALPGGTGGEAHGWLRARLASGHYRVEAASGDKYALPVEAPPSIARIGLAMSVHAGPVAPEDVIVENGLEWKRPVPAHTGERPAFAPFSAAAPGPRALYLGLRASPGQLAGRRLNLYLGMAQQGARAIDRNGGATHRDAAPPRWQISAAGGWRDCVCEDRTGGMREPGFVEVTFPSDDVTPWPGTLLDADPHLLWLRVTVDGETPPLRQIVLNAVSAVQALRFERELLGSAAGQPSQTFQTARAPVVGEVRIEVRETDTGSPQDWVRWRVVDDFAASAHDARDCVCDRLTGAVRFGDGRRGRLPPAGGNNVRISYSAGGGAQGNQPPLAISQLRTTVPYIAAVANCDRATGGQDAPGEHTARHAALARLRHRSRAVCPDDYADLALRASPQVARAACLAARDVSDGRAHAPHAGGIVSVVVAPLGEERAPQPPRALLATVRRYLEARAPAGVEIVLAGPRYVQVCVDAELAVSADASPERVRAASAACFDAWLHPLTGGNAGRGWGFGVEPHASDLLACLAGIDGIDAVRALRLNFVEPAPNVRASGDFLICSGSHHIRASR